MLAYIFIVEGVGEIAGYAGVAEYMRAHGVDGRLLPLVIVIELGGGLLIVFGFKTRCAAIWPCGFCLLTALFFHAGSDQAIELQKNIAMAGGFLALAILGAGTWSLDAPGALAPARNGKRPTASPSRSCLIWAPPKRYNLVKGPSGLTSSNLLTGV